ncbi:hypothetical protein NHX12_009675 [Muraenolepis orangiensis]|uniref:Uncharacterized protein n=1 Tax=Muraenolepis orangiensis TaxID=630683 RepID=A0A9Q0I9Q6_9TELE|nr:hypothetical protein NHX12_009675 [Muraenolepis orangiensis]
MLCKVRLNWTLEQTQGGGGGVEIQGGETQGGPTATVPTAKTESFLFPILHQVVGFHKGLSVVWGTSQTLQWICTTLQEVRTVRTIGGVLWWRSSQVIGSYGRQSYAVSLEHLFS